ncbi:hypothetical protein D9M71_610430 [compost metagenome]
MGNNDAHLKNLSFFVTPGGIDLAPFYDLLCTAVYGNADSPAPWLDAELVWKVDGMRAHAEVSRDHVLEMGRQLGLPQRIAEKLMDELIATATEEANKAVEAAVQTMSAGEVRLLRRIVFGVMQDMAARMRTGASR